MAAIARSDPATIIRSLAEQQLTYYLSLSGWETFGKGWTTRTNQRRTAAQQLVGITMASTSAAAPVVLATGAAALATTGGQTPVIALQPSHSLANVVDHPGSTWAGLGVAAVTIGNAVQSGAMPTTPAGWIAFIAGLAAAVAAALGK